jgi:hypothetical protein
MDLPSVAGIKEMNSDVGSFSLMYFLNYIQWINEKTSASRQLGVGSRPMYYKAQQARRGRCRLSSLLQRVDRLRAD